MHIKTSPILLIGLSTILCTVPLLTSGQTPDTPTPQDSAPSGGGRFWVAELQGGSYLLNLDAVASVAKHTFLVPGLGRVTEVTVDTTGSVAARFYHVNELPTQAPGGIGQTILDQATSRLEELKERISPSATGLAPWQQVIKNYPDATHAHTVEFRLTSEDTLNDLYKSLTNSVQRGRGATFKSK